MVGLVDLFLSVFNLLGYSEELLFLELDLSMEFGGTCFLDSRFDSEGLLEHALFLLEEFDDLGLDLLDLVF